MSMPRKRSPRAASNPAPAACITREGSCTRLTVRGRPVILLGGELHNSSASSLEYLEPILHRLAGRHFNVVLAPVAWELLEPEEGCFDFTLVDGMVRLAREAGLFLVPLWFGAMKNAMNCYVPAWVKGDWVRFPRAQSAPGHFARACSVFSEETLRCDARAFAALMRRIRTVDGRHGTVPLVQVENETGMLGAPRDRTPEAECAFTAPVPAALLQHLAAHRDELPPELAAGLRARGQERASWQAVFGTAADEVFMAWHMARFVDQVAAAGRAEYDLPMFANAWLQQGPGYLPGQYPSGGPVARMLDVWRAAAPHLDALAPDIYQPDFRAHCAAYHRPDNPLLIPEARPGPEAAANALYAVGRHHALLFAPFGIDDLDVAHPLAATYEALAGLVPLLCEAVGTSRLTGFLQQADEEKWTAEMGRFRFNVRTNGTLAAGRVPGAAVLLQVTDDEFVAVGQNLIFTFEPLDPALKTGEVLDLDVGAFRSGQWVPGRRLNGDETYHGTGVWLRETLTTQRFRLHASP